MAVTSLIDAQIRAGEEFRRALRRASGPADLEVLKAELSAWSTGNERALAGVFGESERRAYRRITAFRGSVTDSFKDERTEMEQTTDSRLRYLHAAVLRIDLAIQTQRKPWWRRGRGGP
jgi:hypothetical protein